MLRFKRFSGLFRRIPLAIAILAGAVAQASAQRIEVLGGAGPTFSGPSLANSTPNLMVGGMVPVAPRIGIRADVLYTVDQEEDLVGANVGGVLSLEAAGSSFNPYLLAGGGIFVSGGGDAEAALNGGLGCKFRASRTIGLFVEARYFRFPAANSLYNEMIFVSAGLSVAL